MSDVPLYPHTVALGGMRQRLCCNACGKPVSTPFIPEPTSTPDRGLVVRAYVQCPECLEREQRDQP